MNDKWICVGDRLRDMKLVGSQVDNLWICFFFLKKLSRENTSRGMLEDEERDGVVEAKIGRQDKERKGCGVGM